MPGPDYTYYLTIGSGAEFGVNPGGEWSLEIKKAEDDFPWCKDYRIKMGGSLIFSGDDYEALMSSDCCEKVQIRIKCDGHDYWYGYFSFPYDCEIDEDTCFIEVTPKPLDKYYYFDMYADRIYTNLSLSTTFQYYDNFPNPADNWVGCYPCELLWDIITDIATNSAFGGAEPSSFTYSTVSTFFQNDLFPDGTNPYPVNNYVTGYKNMLNNIVFAFAIDICNQETVVGNCQDMPEWSWNDIMDIVHNVFNTWWYIDEAGDIRVEHISFWELYFGTGYDLTLIDGGRWIENLNKYAFNFDQLPLRESWIYNSVSYASESQYAAYIEYNCYLPGVAFYIKEYNNKDLSTDFEWVAPGTNNFLGGPTACSDLDDTCYMFIHCESRADLQAQGYGVLPACPWCAYWANHVVDGLPHVNGHLNRYNLIINYWMHDRPFWDGTIAVLGITPIVFHSTWKKLIQQDIIFPVCCDAEAEIVLTGNVGADPRYLWDFPIIDGSIITQYGDGDVNDGNISPDGMFNGTLEFEDLCDHDSPTEFSGASDF